MNMRCLALLCCLAPAFGQGLRHPVRAELVAENVTAQPGKTFTVGLRLRLDPGWHVYWRNPGDAGMPPTIEWTLPKGVKAAPILWPAPHRIDMQGSITYGYSGEVLFPVKISLPADFGEKSVTLKTLATWLVCKDVCVDGSARLGVVIPVTDKEPRPDPRHARLFRAARDALPKPLPEKAIHVVRRGGTLVLVTRLPADKLSFFCRDEGVVDVNAPQRATDEGLALTLVGDAPKRLRGVLVEDARIRRAHSIDLHVPATEG